MIEIGDQCRNRWRSILPMFGIGANYLDGKHGPCPICEGADRFRFDDKDGRGTFFCTNCRPGDGMKLIMLKTGRTFGDVAKEIRERLGETRETPPPRKITPEKARSASGGLWTGSSPIFGDDAAIYLASRGLPGPYPGTLRFCPAARVSRSSDEDNAAGDARACHRSREGFRSTSTARSSKMARRREFPRRAR
jgi:hypothetical protein